MTQSKPKCVQVTKGHHDLRMLLVHDGQHYVDCHITPDALTEYHQQLKRPPATAPPAGALAEARAIGVAPGGRGGRGKGAHVNPLPPVEVPPAHKPTLNEFGRDKALIQLVDWRWSTCALALSAISSRIHLRCLS